MEHQVLFKIAAIAAFVAICFAFSEAKPFPTGSSPPPDPSSCAPSDGGNSTDPSDGSTDPSDGSTDPSDGSSDPSGGLSALFADMNTADSSGQQSMTTQANGKVNVGGDNSGYTQGVESSFNTQTMGSPSDPSASDPPASDPPASDPPASDPPASDPPASDPPASDPPAPEDCPAPTPPPDSC